MNEIDLCVSGSDAISQVKAVLNGLDVDPDAATEVDISIRLEESEEPETPNGNASNGSKERSLEGIRPNTNHHLVLSYLAGGGRVTSTEAMEDLAEADIGETSIQPALSELYYKKLVNRSEDSQGAEYWISDHGQNVIEELGKADV